MPLYLSIARRRSSTGTHLSVDARRNATLVVGGPVSLPDFGTSRMLGSGNGAGQM